jgi:sec-independent protein translocase protein TatC
MDSTEKKPDSKPEGSATVPPENGTTGPETAGVSDPASDATMPYSHYDEFGNEEPVAAPPAPATKAVTVPPSKPPNSPPPEDDEDSDEDGMLRMSFLEHLEELRSRLIKALIGIGVAFAVSLFFTNELWQIIKEPAEAALKSLGVKNTHLVMVTPTESFSIIWVKLPVLTAIFLSCPWILYQVWSFVAPGLYKRERRWAAPFIIVSAGLFIAGGLFGYFVAFRFGLAFLLSIGIGNDVDAMLSITEYFDTFVNVTLALGIVFELPVLIFFLALLRLVTPQFLIRNSRYAILIIVIIAAIVTPTPDVINLMLISVPMAILYFAGVFATYLLWLSRENKRFPWGLTLFILLILLSLAAAAIYVAVTRFGYRLEPVWPYLVR